MAARIEPMGGWVLLTREEPDHGTGARRGGWYIAWHEVFPRKQDALQFAADASWRPPFKAVRGSLSAATS